MSLEADKQAFEQLGLTEEEAGRLSPEELQELVELQKAESSSQERVEFLEDPEMQELMEQPEESQPVEPAEEEESTLMDKISTGIISAGDELTFGMLPEISAAVSATQDAWDKGDLNFSDWVAAQEQYGQEHRKIFDAMSADNPIASTAGAMVGGAAQLATPFAKGIQAATQSVKGIMALGALHGLGRSTTSQNSLVEEVSFGALGGAVGGLLGKGVGAAAKKFGKGAVQEFGEAVTPHQAKQVEEIDFFNKKVSTFVESLGIRGKESIKKTRSMLDDVNISEDEFITDIIHELDLTDIVDERGVAKSIKDAARNVQGRLDEIDVELAPLIDKSSFTTSDVAEEIATMLHGKASNDDVVNILAKIGIFQDAPEKAVGFDWLNKTKNIIDKLIKNPPEDFPDVDALGRVRAALKSTTDNIYKDANVLVDPLDDAAMSKMKLLKQAAVEENRKLASLEVLGNNMDNYIAEGIDDVQKYGAFMSDLKLRAGLLVGAAGVGAAVGSEHGSLAGAATTILTFNVGSQGYKALASLARNRSFKALPKQAESLRKIASHIEINPGKYNPRVQAILAASTKAGSGEFVQQLGLLESEINLSESPLKRDSDDLLTKIGDVSNLLREQNSGVAAALARAIATGDDQTIGTIMSSISNLPGTDEYIEPGLGWDGRLFTEIDMKQATKLVEGARLGAKMEMKLKEEIKAGILPSIQRNTPTHKVLKPAKRVNGKKKQEL